MTLPCMDTMLKPKMMSEPPITASTLKNNYSELLKDVSIRSIQYHPQKKTPFTDSARNYEASIL